MAFAHCFAKPMRHEPSGLVGDLQGAVKLMGADALFSGRHQVRSLKPDMQPNVAALKDGAHGHGKFALARAAAAHAHTSAFHVRNAIKAATTRAMRTLRPHDCLQPGKGCGFVVKVRCRQNGHDGFPLRLFISRGTRTCQVYNSHRGEDTRSNPAWPVVNQIRTYWWCGLPRTGLQRMVPASSTARETGASFSKDKCVRTSL